MAKIILGIVALAAGFVAAVLLASELGGEVVVLQTVDAQGRTRDTSLWIVEDNRQLYLRAGDPDSAWLARLLAEPRVVLERGGEKRSYQAQVVDSQRERVSQLMARDYGWADRIIGLMRDEGGSLAVRLDPAPR